MKARTPMTIVRTSVCVISANLPWSAVFRVPPHAVICLFSDAEICSIPDEGEYKTA